MTQKILYVRLPCNPIFPIGVVYLADFVHKLFPELEQKIFDLGTVPPLDFVSALERCIDEFQPTLLVFSWRDLQSYAPVGNRGGNPLQNAFEFYYAKKPLVKLRGALGGLKVTTAYYGELWRNLSLIKRGLKRAKKYHPQARSIVGGGAVSVFYEQLKSQLPKGTIVSVGEGEQLLAKLLRNQDFRSVNYSFNVIDETFDTIRQTIAYHRELERLFGMDKVEPAIFFIGLQPHTHLEEYAFKNNILKPGYNPMSLMPWTAKKLLWNPEPLGSFFGEVCLQAWQTNPNDFGREVMKILEKRLGIAPLEEALSAPVESELKELVMASSSK